MAFYVRLSRLSDNGTTATYRYSADQQRFGEAMVDKASGEVRIVSGLAGDEGGQVAARAAAKLRSAWRSGPMPEQAEWAS